MALKKERVSLMMNSGSASYQSFLLVQLLHLEKAKQDLYTKERTKRVSNGCWHLH
jgi:hypothetical protein